MSELRVYSRMRPGFEQCLCPGPHPFPLTWDRHHLWPLGWDGPDTSDNLARACPNAHRLSHTMLNRMKRNGGHLPYREAIRFGHYPKKMAELGWDLMVAGRTVRFAVLIPLLPDLHE